MTANPLTTNADASARLLKARCFRPEDQEQFALLSGDCNPLHMDPVAARRTLIGAVAVHGVNLTLVALELFLERFGGSGGICLLGLEAQFAKPVAVGEKVAFRLVQQSGEGFRVTGSVEEDIVLRVAVRLGTEKIDRGGCAPVLAPEPLVEADFDLLATAEGTLPVGIDRESARRMFPHVFETLGDVAFAEVLALTRLVGMRCPGLHSLFSQLSISFRSGGDAGDLYFRVEKADSRFRRLVLQVQGTRLGGHLTVFVRPPPEPQPTIGEVACRVVAGSFANSVALVIGGSRGIGEVTAKIIAAGGGVPIVTFFQGVKEAERIAAEIRDWGGRCELEQLDVQRGSSAIRSLARRKIRPRSLYYFATPKIGGRRRGFFSHRNLAEFNKYYVEGFGRVVDAAAAGVSSLRVFYPSSVFLEEDAREHAEYVMAKRAGEALCAFYNRYAGNVRTVVSRLPRIRTDQNSSLLPILTEDALEVMLPIVGEMELWV